MERLIKRYDNRKMYDTVGSEYVSLKDIAAFVRQGDTVKIIDNTTGTDLTGATLTQVILEEGRQGKSIIPPDLLHDLLRRSSEALDSGLHQIRGSVDGLMQMSVDRINKLMQTPRSDELAKLREQLGQLDRLLERLLEKKEDTE